MVQAVDARPDSPPVAALPPAKTEVNHAEMAPPQPPEMELVPPLPTRAPLIPTQEQINAMWQLAGIFEGGQSGKNPLRADQIFTSMLAGFELGWSPTRSRNAFTFINGVMGMTSMALQAICLSRPDVCLYLKVVDETPQYATVETWRRNRNAAERMTFTLQEAQSAGLVKDRSAWKTFPGQMCAHRAATKLIRRVYPDLVLGLPRPIEEIEGIVAAEDGPGLFGKASPQEIAQAQHEYQAKALGPNHFEAQILEQRGVAPQPARQLQQPPTAHHQPQHPPAAPQPAPAAPYGHPGAHQHQAPAHPQQPYPQPTAPIAVPPAFEAPPADLTRRGLFNWVVSQLEIVADTHALKQLKAAAWHSAKGLGITAEQMSQELSHTFAARESELTRQEANYA